MNAHRQGLWRAAGLLAASLVCAAPRSHAAGAGPPIRVAVSEDVAGEVNSNDLRAAMSAWSGAIARQTGVRIEPIICTTGQLVQKVRNRQVDAFSLNVLEFPQVAPFVDQEVVTDKSELQTGTEYLLLVHRSGGIQTLANLRGRSLLFYRNVRTCLGRIWLDTLLASAHLGTSDTLLGRMESNSKLSRVVLPVFFRQADACLVTRRGYDTMCELNPQLAAQLRVLAESPKLRTGFLGVHKDNSPESKRRFLTAITELNATVEGRQALLLFGGTQLVRTDLSVLRTSLDLMQTYERLLGKPPVSGE